MPSTDMVKTTAYSQYYFFIHMIISVNEESTLEHKMTRSETLLC